MLCARRLRVHAFCGYIACDGAEAALTAKIEDAAQRHQQAGEAKVCCISNNGISHELGEARSGASGAPTNLPSMPVYFHLGGQVLDKDSRLEKFKLDFEVGCCIL